MSGELTKKSPAEIELVRQIQQTAYTTALESFVEKNKITAGLDQPAILMAEAQLAADKLAEHRTPAEKALVRLTDTMAVVANAAERGLVTNPEDAELLSDALIYASISPGSAIKYLRPTGGNKLDRALTPKELVGAMMLREDFIFGEEKEQVVSIATLVRIADSIGISLAETLSDADMDMLMTSMDVYQGSVEHSTVEDDPIDGPVAGRKKHQIRGATLVRRTVASPNPAYDDDMTIGATRVDAFADMAGIEDKDEILSLYEQGE